MADQLVKRITVELAFISRHLSHISTFDYYSTNHFAMLDFSCDLR